jgi:hypothetical protein
MRDEPFFDPIGEALQNILGELERLEASEALDETSPAELHAAIARVLATLEKIARPLFDADPSAKAKFDWLCRKRLQ